MVEHRFEKQFWAVFLGPSVGTDMIRIQRNRAVELLCERDNSVKSSLTTFAHEVTFIRIFSSIVEDGTGA